MPRELHADLQGYLHSVHSDARAGVVHAQVIAETFDRVTVAMRLMPWQIEALRLAYLYERLDVEVWTSELGRRASLAAGELASLEVRGLLQRCGASSDESVRWRLTEVGAQTLADHQHREPVRSVLGTVVDRLLFDQEVPGCSDAG